jgi:hypothetical protein
MLKSDDGKEEAVDEDDGEGQHGDASDGSITEVIRRGGPMSMQRARSVEDFATEDRPSTMRTHYLTKTLTPSSSTAKASSTANANPPSRRNADAV